MTDLPDRVSLRLNKNNDSDLNDLMTFHLRGEPRKFIDAIVERGLYQNRSEFIRMAIEQKMDKVIEKLHDPFYKELIQE